MNTDSIRVERRSQLSLVVRWHDFSGKMVLMKKFGVVQDHPENHPD